MKKRNMFLIAGGAMLGAVCAKIYYDRQKILTSDYVDTMEHLENETNFEYSPAFKRELKREAVEQKKSEMAKEKSSINFDELLNKIDACKAGLIDSATKAETHIRTLMAKHGLVERANFVDESEFVESVAEEAIEENVVSELTPDIDCPIVETVDVAEATDVLDTEMSSEPVVE